MFNICFTGISGSGKSTLAESVNQKLTERKIRIQVIDGDDTRQEIGHLFGHTKEERMKMNAVNRLLVKYLNQNGINTLIAIVAPFEEMRLTMRECFQDSYIEVYVKCSRETCVQRDVKGYYKLEKQGMLQNLNGSNDIYEIPQCPDITVDTDFESAESATERIINYLVDNGYVV